MSGVAAAVRFDGGPAPIAQLEALVDASPHRRPDGCTIWSGAGAALAKLHRLVLPEQTVAAQPAVDRDGLVAVFDGRLDNRTEIAARFADAPLGDADDDVQYVLTAISRLGDAAIDTLEGDFALVIWDSRRRRLTVARDALGQRPLYWMRDGDVLLVASDVAQVLAAATHAPAPDRGAITDILLSEPPTDGRTLYSGVRRVLGGELLHADSRGIRGCRFWAATAAAPDRNRREDDYAEECRSLLDRSVAARLRARTAVAIFFSGGIDSSAVLTSALRVGGARLEPLSIDFRDPESEERRYREEFVAFHGIRNTELDPAPFDVDLYVSQARRRRLPPDMPGLALARSARQIAHDRGTRVALTGEGGDALFAGTPHQYADLIRRGRLLAAVAQYLSDRREQDSGWRRAGLLTDGIWPLLPYRVRDVLRQPLRRLLGDGSGVSWVRGSGTPRRTVPAPPPGVPLSTFAVAWNFNRGWTWYFLEMLERDAAEWQIELRHPLLDRRVVEFALRLPEEQRRFRGADKAVLRRASRFPPALAVRRTKATLALSMTRALEALGGRRLFETLALAEGGWVDAAEVLRGYDYIRRAVFPGDDRADTLLPRLWMIAALELWLRKGVHVEAGRPEARAAATRS